MQSATRQLIVDRAHPNCLRTIDAACASRVIRTCSVRINRRTHATRCVDKGDKVVTELQPVPVVEIITALEREAACETDARWLAAQYLRHMPEWQTRTLMCRIDDGPSETLASVY